MPNFCFQLSFPCHISHPHLETMEAVRKLYHFMLTNHHDSGKRELGHSADRSLVFPRFVVHVSRSMAKPTMWLYAQRRLMPRLIRVFAVGWSESSLCAQRVAKDPSFLHADSEDSDKTGRMPRLNWAFAGLTLSLLVLSYRGSGNYSCSWCQRRAASFEPRLEKTFLCHMRTTKTQISLRIRSVWSSPLLFAV